MICYFEIPHFAHWSISSELERMGDVMVMAYFKESSQHLPPMNGNNLNHVRHDLNHMHLKQLWHMLPLNQPIHFWGVKYMNNIQN
jgi:hypothetical protein